MNRQEEIKKQLTDWFDLMLAKYTWLKVKYEYNVNKECYLISFCISPDLECSDAFDKDVLEFEKAMGNKYGDYSPLFCDNERLFKLSPNAEVVENFTPNAFVNESSIEIAQFDLGEMFVCHSGDIEISGVYEFLTMAA